MKDVLTIQRADHLTDAQATAMAVHQAEATAHLKAEVMVLQREGAMDIHQKDAATATPTEGAAMETPTGEAVMAARTEEAATADHLKAEATEIPREDPMVHLQKEEASVRQAEEHLTAHQKEEASVRQAEEHLTAHQRAEVSVRQAEGLSQVKAEVQKEEASAHQENRSADVTTELEEADSRAADLQEEAQLHAETDVEWMPREPRPNRIHTNSTRLTSRI